MKRVFDARSRTFTIFLLAPRDYVERILFIIRVHRRMSPEQRQINIVAFGYVHSDFLWKSSGCFREKISRELEEVTSRD